MAEACGDGRRASAISGIDEDLDKAALIRRPSGDGNPSHVDPAFAGRTGFPKPVLPGFPPAAISATRSRGPCAATTRHDAAHPDLARCGRVVADNGLAEIAMDQSPFP
jgi:MaoC like domain